MIWEFSAITINQEMEHKFETRMQRELSLMNDSKASDAVNLASNQKSMLKGFEQSKFRLEGDIDMLKWFIGSEDGDFDDMVGRIIQRAMVAVDCFYKRKKDFIMCDLKLKSSSLSFTSAKFKESAEKLIEACETLIENVKTTVFELDVINKKFEARK